MTNNDQRKCDVDDIVCQMTVLSNMKALESSLGDEEFREKYPEAAALRDKITEDIKTQEHVVSDSLAACASPEESEENVLTIKPKVVREVIGGEPVPED